MAFKIFPTENDVGPIAGDGRKSTEPNMSSWLEQARPISTFYADGTTVGAGGVGTGYNFDLAAHTPGLSADITSGTANVRGFRTESDATIAVTCTASMHNHLYLALTKVSSLVTTATITNIVTSTRDNIGTPPADSIYLWDLLCDGSTVTVAHDYRNFSAGMCVGTYQGDGTDNRLINIGFMPKLVMVQGIGVGSTDFIFSMSPVNYYQGSATPHGGRGMIYAQSSDQTKSAAVLSSATQLFAEYDKDGFTVDGLTQVALDSWQTFKVTDTGRSTATGWFATVTGAEVGDALDVNYELEVTPFTKTRDVSGSAAVTAADTVFVPGLGSAVLHTTRITVIQHKSLSKSLNDSGEEYFFTAWA